MFRLIDRFEKSLLRGHRFVGDVFYYWWIRDHPFLRAIELAKVTIYH